LIVDKTLLFRTKSIGKLSLCVKEERVTICGGFELFHAGNVVLDTRNKEAYLFGDRNYSINDKIIHHSLPSELVENKEIRER